MASATRGNSITADTTTGAAVPPYSYAGAAPYDYSSNASNTINQLYPINITQIIITNTGTPATLQIKDGGNTNVAALPLINLSTNEASNISSVFTFPTPINFPNGIIISSITNCTAQIIFTKNSSK